MRNLFLLGLLLLFFVASVASQRYGLPPAMLVDEALQASEAHIQKAFGEPPAPPGWNTDDAITQGKVLLSNPKSVAGYTLITIRYAPIVYLLDNTGRIAHRWKLAFEDAWKKPTHVKQPVNTISFRDAEMFPNGDLIAIYDGQGDTPYGYGLIKMDKNSKVIWTYDEAAHHDFYIDKHNGTIYTLIHKDIESPIKGLENVTYPALIDYIVILSPSGKELKRLSLAEMLRDSQYKALLYQRPEFLSLSWDLLHANSIMKLEPEMAKAFPMFKPGDILISIRNLHAIAVIDPEEGRIKWATTGVWKYQHAARFMPDGTIALVDNLGLQIKNLAYSRVLKFNPSNNAITWQYGGEKQPFFTATNGRIQRLYNGNLLITETQEARIFEVTEDGEVVWDYHLPKYYLNMSALELWQYRHAHRELDAQTVEIFRKEKMLTAITNAARYSPSEATFLKQ